MFAVLVLGIETSCDETSVAVVKDKFDVLSNVVCSQVDFHQFFGGVVPEIASRKHLEFIAPALERALKEAGIALADLSGVAVTNGPGLVGSLVIGTSVAKAIAYAQKLPLVAVNHLEGHLFSCFLEEPSLKFPFLCLIVSGGHTELILARDVGVYEVLGRTRDDAAGEAFDKVARALNLGFPGGPAIDRAAEEGNFRAISFPRADLSKTLDFSFSGLKTAVVRFLRGYDRQLIACEENSSSLTNSPTHPIALSSDVVAQRPFRLEDVAASFQEAVVDMLVQNVVRAVEQTRASVVGVAGGVAANRRLRKGMAEAAAQHSFRLVIPSPITCTDNAAMIACAGSFRLERQLIDGLSIDVYAVKGIA